MNGMNCYAKLRYPAAQNRLMSMQYASQFRNSFIRADP